jgi:hypothetical protein
VMARLPSYKRPMAFPVATATMVSLLGGKHHRWFLHHLRQPTHVRVGGLHHYGLVATATPLSILTHNARACSGSLSVSRSCLPPVQLRYRVIRCTSSCAGAPPQPSCPGVGLNMKARWCKDMQCFINVARHGVALSSHRPRDLPEARSPPPPTVVSSAWSMLHAPHVSANPPPSHTENPGNMHHHIMW